MTYINHVIPLDPSSGESFLALDSIKFRILEFLRQFLDLLFITFHVSFMIEQVPVEFDVPVGDLGSRSMDEDMTCWSRIGFGGK